MSPIYHLLLWGLTCLRTHSIIEPLGTFRSHLTSRVLVMVLIHLTGYYKGEGRNRGGDGPQDTHHILSPAETGA